MAGAAGINAADSNARFTSSSAICCVIVFTVALVVDSEEAMLLEVVSAGLCANTMLAVATSKPTTVANTQSISGLRLIEDTSKVQTGFRSLVAAFSQLLNFLLIVWKFSCHKRFRAITGRRRAYDSYHVIRKY
ncbi:hypothetical protein SD80_019155 [Scytonema tolypothrichoides VB-61278]|nr:hypothetical protein SD80_019155 [Scytonema tolypothrichoides VB-61278]